MARKPKYKPIDMGDIVYLRTDPEKQPRLVVSLKVHPSGMVKYKLAFGHHFSKHFEFEMEREPQKRLEIKGLKTT